MDIEILENDEAVAKRAAEFIAAFAREAIASRGKFVMALSGGRTPWQMLRFLAKEDLPWKQVHVVQVDERIAATGSPDRNLTHLLANLLPHSSLLPENIHAMPVESSDLNRAAKDYSQTLEQLLGTSPVLDLVHLGLGSDGHTASLVPGDPALEVTDADVAVTGIYQGLRRMTLTYPILNRARQIVWMVTGSDKQEPLHRLRAADPSIPAGRICQEHALLLTDFVAAGRL